MLSVDTIAPVLAAAFARPEAEIRLTLVALSECGLLPRRDDEPLDALGGASVVIAFVAGVPVDQVAAETLRLSGFRCSGCYERIEHAISSTVQWFAHEVPNTLAQALAGMIDRIRTNTLPCSPQTVPYQLRSRMGTGTDWVSVESLSRDGQGAAVFSGLYFTPAGATEPALCSGLAVTRWVAIPWLAVWTLAEMMGPPTKADAEMRAGMTLERREMGEF